MTKARHIAIVDDEANIGRSLRLILEGEGYRVTVCDSMTEFHTRGLIGHADAYLLDVLLPDGNGIALLKEIRDQDDAAPVVMISGHGTIRDAVEATQSGAFDFLEKPLSRDRVLLVLRNALERAELRRDNQRFRDLVGDGPRIIGRSAAIERALRDATRVAQSDAGVLLTGESGSGKELLAAHIHRESRLASRPMITLNCAAIPTELIESELFGHEKGAFTGATGLRRGKFELANGGSLFLDEVGDLHETSQAKLLRVLQDGVVTRLGGEQPLRVSVRIISATNQPLEQMVAEGTFRQDLYYRLAVVPIRVPSLRERPDDIGELAAYFLTEFCARNNFRPKHLDEGVVTVLERYRWPGNVRELRNTVERMAILTLGERITVDVVPAELRGTDGMGAASRGLQGVRDAAERERIAQALEHANWNISQAARILDVERTALHKRIRALGLTRPTP